MSLDLNCPNCGSLIGCSDIEDNYQYHYYYTDNNGVPICLYCKVKKYNYKFKLFYI